MTYEPITNQRNSFTEKFGAVVFNLFIALLNLSCLQGSGIFIPLIRLSDALLLSKPLH